MQTTAAIKLDVASYLCPPTVYAKQNDKGTRFVEATLLDNGAPYTIENGTTARIRILKPDNTMIYNNATISSGKVTAELYDKENDSYISAKYCTDKRTVIIIEGIFLQRKELDGVFGLMVYMDVSEEERLKRVLTRDTYIGDDSEIRRKYEDRYFPAERRYVQEYEPAQKADMVIKA